ncbi:MAG: trypsin-like serine protease [Rhodospirillaceae bacterium]|jgi:serine protease Do|nr:trypsin-like serine protease [Rhodospirillaceae bacterium]
MRKFFGTLILCVSLLGCQTVQTDGNGESIYHIFFTQADHIKELLAKGKVQEASDVYSEHENFFLGKGNAFNELLAKLRTGVEGLASSELHGVTARAEAQDWPVEREHWSSISTLLKTLENRTTQWKSNAILSRETRSSTISSAERAHSRLREKIENSASDEFEQFDLFSDPSFSASYPIDVDLASLIADDAERILALIQDGDRGRIIDFKARYSRHLPPSLKSELGDIYFEKTFAALLAEKKSRVVALLKAIEQSGDAGFDLDIIDAARVKAVDITSKTLMNAEQIEFPIQLKSDLPIAVETSDLDKALSIDAEVDTEILVLIDIAAAKVNRDIHAFEPVSSEHQVGTQSYQNPSYAGAQNSVTQAQMEFQSANMGKMSADSMYCTGYGCIAKAIGQIAAAVKVSDAQEVLTSAMSNLQSTPMMLERPVYATYSFRKASIDASKLAIVNYYVIDKHAGEYVEGTFDIKQEQSFTVAYNMKEKDRYRSRHLSGSDTEKDIELFEEKPLAVSLTSIIEEYGLAKKPPAKLVSLHELRTQILKDKNIAIARFQADRIKAADNTIHDELAESVVIVHNLNGSLGSGFYVNDDLVLTNYHVVEESSFVELTLKNGKETFGKIIAKDVRLDLALIRTQHRGEPVKFHHGNDIEVGATTFAIGHPKGLEFSVTRGIVSAIRAHKNVVFGGGKDVYFVQTDTPINSGNSGGPLFLDGQVIGVNDFVISKQIAEGLNFAIHVKEVLKFLKKQNVGVNMEGATS